MKKILILIAVIFTALVTTTSVAYADDTIYDQKVAIEIVKDNNTITINHTSGLDISKAVVEYAFLQDNQKIAMLDTFDVKNNKFTVNRNVFAVKVHQIKVLKKNVYYTYATTNVNTAGSLAGVERRNIVEIQTTDVNTIKSNLEVGYLTQHRVFEFYFDFEKQHDEILSIDVDYVLYKKRLGLFPYGYENYTEQKLTFGSNWTIAQYNAGSLNKTYKQLEKNSTEFKGEYVARVAPTSNESKASGRVFDFQSTYFVENFAIVRIAYKIDGEFIIDDVINDPTTPIDDDLNYILSFIEKTKSAINSVVSWFNSSLSSIIKVAAVILIVIAYVLLSPVFKIVIKIIKLFFKGIVQIFALLFGWLF